MSDHIETPDTDDVDGHYQAIDDEGRASVPPTRRVALTDSTSEDDDVEGHVLDLDIERKR